MLGFGDDEIGLSRDEWTQLMHPDDFGRSCRGRRSTSMAVLPAFEMEHRMLHQDGTVRWFLARAAAIRSAGAVRSG